MFTRREKVPPYVALIAADYLVLDGDVRSVKRAILESRHGKRLTRGLFGWTLRFTPSPGGDLKNEDLQQLMVAVCSFGIAFGEDYKQGWSPADVAREFKEMGVLNLPIRTISWSGPGKWQLLDHP